MHIPVCLYVMFIWTHVFKLQKNKQTKKTVVLPVFVVFFPSFFVKIDSFSFEKSFFGRAFFPVRSKNDLYQDFVTHTCFVSWLCHGLSSLLLWILSLGQGVYHLTNTGSDLIGLDIGATFCFAVVVFWIYSNWLNICQPFQLESSLFS